MPRRAVPRHGGGTRVPDLRGCGWLGWQSLELKTLVDSHFGLMGLMGFYSKARCFDCFGVVSDQPLVPIHGSEDLATVGALSRALTPKRQPVNEEMLHLKWSSSFGGPKSLQGR